MNTLTLQELRIESFKGIKSFAFEPNGQNASILAENGIGKTTVSDAFYWLNWGKDSTGRKDFDIWPLDSENNPIGGLTLAVQGVYLWNDRKITLRKELKEKIVKGQTKGYETLCWIDEVPKKVGEYAEFIGSMIDEDTFKLLTDLHFFNEKWHWSDRRKLLMDLAGEIKTQKQFSELVAELNGREIEDFKKVVAEQKKRLVKDRDEINPRIDEIQKSLDEYAQNAAGNQADLETRRMALQAQIQDLDNARKKILSSEQKRQALLEQINQLKSKLAERETALRNDTAGHAPLIEEKEKLNRKLDLKRQEIRDQQQIIDNKNAEIESQKRKLEQIQAALSEIKQQYQEIEGADYSKAVCNACGQTLPANKITDLKSKQASRLQEITAKGNAKMGEKKALLAEIEKIDTDIKGLKEKLAAETKALDEGEAYCKARFAQIDEQLQNRVSVKPQDDPAWKQIAADIERLEKSVGPSPSEQLMAIETERAEKASELEKVSATLLNADTIKKSAARIKELEAQEKELGVQIAALDGKLDQIDQYQADQSRQIELAVNGKFKYVKFKLFEQLLNGGLEPCCEAMLNGTPYPDLSYGEKKRVGADVVSVLSDHYGVSAPIFVDNRESLTFDLELKCQTISLIADKNVKELTVEIDGQQPKKATAKKQKPTFFEE